MHWSFDYLIPGGAPIDSGMAGVEGAGHAEAGPRGVGDVYVDLYHGIDVPARRAASHVFVLLNTQEAVITEKEVRTECSNGKWAPYCQSKEE